MLERLRQAHFAWFHLVAILGAVFYFFLINNSAQPDLWGRLSIGALLEQNNFQFPYRDVFNYTAPNALWFDHEWGAGVIYYWMVKTLGSGSLFWLQITLYGTTLWLILSRMLSALKETDDTERPAKNVMIAVLFPAMALLMCTLYVPTIWSHDFTFFFYALFLWLLEQSRNQQQGKLALLLPAIMVLWVNTHGGFIVGFCLLGMYFLESLWNRNQPRSMMLGLSLVLCGGAALMNPYGFDFLTHIWTFWFLDRSQVADWDWVFSTRMPPLQPVYGILYTACYLLWITVAFIDWIKKGVRCFPLILLLIAATGYEGFIHYKLVPIFMVTALGLGLQLKAPQLNIPSLPKGLVNRFHAITRYLIPMALIAAALYMNATTIMSTPQPFAVKVPDSVGMRYPTGAVQFLQTNRIRGNLWTTFIWGEYLYWCLYPDMKVSMDGRFETVYPMAVFDDFMRFSTPPYDLDMAAKYKTTHVLVPNDTVNTEFFDAVQARTAWVILYQDETSILYTLSPSQIQPAPSPPEPLQTVDDFLGDLSRFRRISPANQPNP